MRFLALPALAPVAKAICAHCSAYRVTDTWAQDRETVEQGLRSVHYNEADEYSLEWVEAFNDED